MFNTLINTIVNIVISCLSKAKRVGITLAIVNNNLLAGYIKQRSYLGITSAIIAKNTLEVFLAGKYSIVGSNKVKILSIFLITIANSFLASCLG